MAAHGLRQIEYNKQKIRFQSGRLRYVLRQTSGDKASFIEEEAKTLLFSVPQDLGSDLLMNASVELCLWSVCDPVLQP